MTGSKLPSYFDLALEISSREIRSTVRFYQIKSQVVNLLEFNAAKDRVRVDGHVEGTERDFVAHACIGVCDGLEPGVESANLEGRLSKIQNLFPYEAVAISRIGFIVGSNQGGKKKKWGGGLAHQRRR